MSIAFEISAGSAVGFSFWQERMKREMIAQLTEPQRSFLETQKDLWGLEQEFLGNPKKPLGDRKSVV